MVAGKEWKVILYLHKLSLDRSPYASGPAPIGRAPSFLGKNGMFGAVWGNTAGALSQA